MTLEYVYGLYCFLFSSFSKWKIPYKDGVVCCAREVVPCSTTICVFRKSRCFITQSKRGVSALELKADLEIKSCGTSWVLLHKIREALRQHDYRYKLHEVIELDGAVFGRKQMGDQTEVLVAIVSLCHAWRTYKKRSRSKQK